ncbi:DUF3883 domain-containing protein [Flavobacterium sp. 245]|uniref:DUF3883 domain-containing protein n=1 Tax=Flavobacterium sp. 245 TaxID=2512115 RepID=UPI001060E1EE|nr:DUF3883 domain-containing protein [Flavobacterium sp. 245]
MILKDATEPVFECSEDLKVVPRMNSKLFLFYPLEIITGFPYIIHSNFSCNPERTSIRDTRLNKFIFDEISTMQTGQLLDYLLEQDYKLKLIDYVYFERSSDKLEYFYRVYTTKLRKRKFIWIDAAQYYVEPKEIIYCSKEIYVFLKGHTIEGRHVFTCEEKIKKFLVDNFNIKTLSNADVLKYIENVAQKEVHNPAFFEKLYSFLIRNNINSYERKILLGGNNELYSKKDDIFSAGGKNAINIPEDISGQLILLHPEIQIKTEDVLKSVRYIGLKEYSRADLVEKALTLFDNELVENYSILRFLIGLESLQQSTKDSISRKIYLPVKNKMEWVMPVYSPVYFESESLMEIYPEASYVDIENCLEKMQGQSGEKLLSFFAECGVWDIPAVYFSKEAIDTTSDSKRTRKINMKTGRSAYGFRISNDRMLDFPSKPNFFFFNSIYSSWSRYEAKISTIDVLDFKVQSTLASSTDSVKQFMSLTSFTKTLQEKSWIFLSQDQQAPLLVRDIVGLNRLDALNEKHLANRLDILVGDFDKYRSFIEILEINHFNTYSRSSIISILNLTASKYQQKEDEPLDADFKRFYHVILKYLFNTYTQIDNSQRELLFRELKGTSFLCRKTCEGSELISWQKPENIYHVDDRLKFDNLPIEAKEMLEYYFTKSDRNEIGRIFSRIGRRTSAEIAESVHIPEHQQECVLFEKVPNAAYVIIAAEDKIEGHLKNETFSLLKDLKLRICQEDLTKEIGLNSVPEFKTFLEMKFYFDTDVNSIYISKKYLPIADHKSLLGEILNSVLSEYLEKDLGINRLIKDLFHSKKSKTFEEALEDIEYDNERVHEIELILEDNEKTAEQEFWSAVLFAKGVEECNEKSLLLSTENCSVLEENLSADSEVISKWFERMNYLNLNTAENFELLKEIIRIEGISFEDINLRLPKPINFGYLRSQEFTAYRNKNLPSLKWMLFQYFKNQGIESRSKFCNALMETEKLELESSEGGIFEFEASIELLRTLNHKYPKLSLTAEELNEAQHGVLWKELLGSLAGKKRQLRAMLKAEGFSLAQLEMFMTQEHYNSLLYFEEFEALKNFYGGLYGKPHQQSATEENFKKPHFPVVAEDHLEIADCIIEEKPQDGYDVLSHAMYKINTYRGSRGGWGQGRTNLVDQNYLNYIGEQGEKLLFLKLSAAYNSNVTWVSENAPCLGFVPDKEAVGYDMRYIDEHNQTHYVEVKTSTGEEPEFHISINEIRAARKYGAQYHVIWITNLFDIQKRQYMDLKNMFIDFKAGEDFFHNSKFYPELTGFKIVFRTQKPAVLEVSLQQ